MTEPGAPKDGRSEPDDAKQPRDEFAEKSVYWNTTTVNARLGGTFAAEDVPRASVLLAGLAPAPDCPEEADLAAARLMLAAIRASEGDLTKLGLWVEAGRADPRDLIAAAEYRGELAEGEEARERDLDEYLAWVSGRR